MAIEVLDNFITRKFFFYYASGELSVKKYKISPETQ